MVFSGEYHMGYPKGFLKGQSWYALLHPSDLAEASLKHKQREALILFDSITVIKPLDTYM